MPPDPCYLVGGYGEIDKEIDNLDSLLISRTLGLHPIWLRSNTRTKSSVTSTIASRACRIPLPMRLTATLTVRAPTATAHGTQRLSLLRHLNHFASQEDEGACNAVSPRR